jgi:hypothetical protein
MREKLFLFIFCCGLSSCTLDKFPIAFLGLDDAGKEFTTFIAGRKYNKKLGKYFNELSTESLSVLEQRKSFNAWELKRIDVGLGITTKLGFAIVSVEATPSFRITFKKQG